MNISRVIVLRNLPSTRIFLSSSVDRSREFLRFIRGEFNEALASGGAIREINSTN